MKNQNKNKLIFYMSIAVQFKAFLDKSIQSKEDKGMTIEHYVVVFRYHLTEIKQNVPVNVSSILPMLEMYLMTKGIKYDLVITGRKTLIKGVYYNKDEFLKLFDTLTTGMQNSPGTLAEAENLYGAATNTKI